MAINIVPQKKSTTPACKTTAKKTAKKKVAKPAR